MKWEVCYNMRMGRGTEYRSVQVNTTGDGEAAQVADQRQKQWPLAEKEDLFGLLCTVLYLYISTCTEYVLVHHNHKADVNGEWGSTVSVSTSTCTCMYNRPSIRDWHDEVAWHMALEAACCATNARFFFLDPSDTPPPSAISALHITHITGYCYWRVTTFSHFNWLATLAMCICQPPRLL